MSVFYFFFILFMNNSCNSEVLKKAVLHYTLLKFSTTFQLGMNHYFPLKTTYMKT